MRLRSPSSGIVGTADAVAVLYCIHLPYACDQLGVTSPMSLFCLFCLKIPGFRAILQWGVCSEHQRLYALYLRADRVGNLSSNSPCKFTLLICFCVVLFCCFYGKRVFLTFWLEFCILTVLFDYLFFSVDCCDCESVWLTSVINLIFPWNFNFFQIKLTVPAQNRCKFRLKMCCQNSSPRRYQKVC